MICVVETIEEEEVAIIKKSGNVMKRFTYLKTPLTQVDKIVVFKRQQKKSLNFGKIRQLNNHSAIAMYKTSKVHHTLEVFIHSVCMQEGKNESVQKLVYFPVINKINLKSLQNDSKIR